MKENYYNCIYMYTSPNGKSYIGKAKDFLKRKQQHINSSYNEKRHDYNYPFHKAIRKYGIENFKIEILKENLTEDEMNYYEDYYIESLKLYVKDGKGYNIAKGGFGGDTCKGKTDEEKNIINEKRSKTLIGRKIEDSTKQLISDALSYKIIQYSKDGDFIKKWDSMMDIQRELGFSQSKICLVCQYYNNPKEFLEKNNSHARLSAYGYLWKYKTDNKEIKRYSDTRTKKISQYSKDGDIIKIWSSFKEITNELGIDRKEIYNVCNGKRKTARGFIWKYTEEVE